MNVKSTLKTEKESNKITDFPCIGISSLDGEIVLFHEHSKGITIHEGRSTHYVSYYSSCWQMNFFSLFKGTIELSNDK